MAEFCTDCTKRLFGPDVKPDIDIDKIFKTLKPGYGVSVLCEGCTLSLIINDGGKLKKLFKVSIDDNQSKD